MAHMCANHLWEFYFIYFLFLQELHLVTDDITTPLLLNTTTVGPVSTPNASTGG